MTRALCLLVAIASLAGCSDPKDKSRVVGMESCRYDCLEVPRGLKGLAFGMSAAEVGQILEGEFRDITSPLIKPTLPREKDDPYGIGVRAPGAYVVVETTIGKFPAACRLSFAIEHRLSRIDCRLEDKSDGAVFNAVLASLLKRYGKPHRENREGLWWSDTSATLHLEERPRDLHRGWFRLQNYSQADLEMREGLPRAANAKLREARADADAKARADKERIERQVREGEQALERDLGAAPESP